MWYKIAEVNGLTAESQLVEGMPLLIPVGVVRTSNTAETFKPYDPLEVLGSTSPTSPAPKKQKCGAFGQVLLVVIAIVVAYYVGPWVLGHAATPAVAATATAAAVPATAATGLTAVFGAGAVANVAAGAIAGAVASIASQGVGVMTGIQDKFSWNAVALAAIGGGVGAGVGVNMPGAGAVTRAVTSNIITQGIGVATGLQREFSWASVAGAALSAQFGKFVDKRLELKAFDAPEGMTIGNFAEHAVSGAARAIASGAARSLIEGSDFGDNVMAALPDVIGQTIGSAIAGGISGNGSTSGESIFDRIGDGLSAVGDFIGFDGSFGYQGPQGRSLSLGGLGDAIGNVIAPPAAAATMTGDAQVIRGFGANGVAHADQR